MLTYTVSKGALVAKFERVCAWRRMAVSHAAAAAAGVTLGFAVGTLGFVVAKPKQPAIVGTFRREDDGSGLS